VSVPIPENTKYRKKKQKEEKVALATDEQYFFEVAVPPNIWRGICLTYDGDAKQV